MELNETDEEYTLNAMLPGLNAEDVNIQFSNGHLSIDGEYKVVEDRVKPLVNEFPSGCFARSFELSYPILAEKIAASMSNGVLTMQVPKAEEAKPRTIKIVAK